MKTGIALLCTMLAATPLAAQAPAPVPTPADFAWQWPIDTGSSDGAVRIVLTSDVYMRVTRADLGDLAAFNASDEPMPFGPAGSAFERLVLPPLPAPIPVPMFRVPRSDARGAERIELHIARASDGRLSRLGADIGDADAASVSDLLLDLTTLDAQATALLLELDPGAGELHARIDVAGSDDLAGWRSLASGVALVSLQENGVRLERTRIELPQATSLRYLRLRRSDSTSALPVAAVRVQPTRSGDAARLDAIPARERLAIEGAKTADAGVFEYRSTGPLPVERVAVDLAERNALAGFVLESRDAESAAWIERARGTAFSIGSDDTVGATPIDIPVVRDRWWRLRTMPAQAQAPYLQLAWRPDTFVLLTQGTAPYRLVAGSASARRADYPLRSVLSELRLRHSDLWLPPEATLGPDLELSGAAALVQPTAAPHYGRWLLWGVLLVGAALIIGMVLKLLRAPAPEGSGRD